MRVFSIIAILFLVVFISFNKKNGKSKSFDKFGASVAKKHANQKTRATTGNKKRDGSVPSRLKWNNPFAKN